MRNMCGYDISVKIKPNLKMTGDDMNDRVENGKKYWHIQTSRNKRKKFKQIMKTIGGEE